MRPGPSFVSEYGAPGRVNLGDQRVAAHAQSTRLDNELHDAGGEQLSSLRGGDDGAHSGPDGEETVADQLCDDLLDGIRVQLELFTTSARRSSIALTDQ